MKQFGDASNNPTANTKADLSGYQISGTAVNTDLGTPFSSTLITENQRQAIRSVFPSKSSITSQTDIGVFKGHFRTLKLKENEINAITNIDEAKKLATSLADAAQVQ